MVHGTVPLVVVSVAGNDVVNATAFQCPPDLAHRVLAITVERYFRPEGWLVPGGDDAIGVVGCQVFPDPCPHGLGHPAARSNLVPLETVGVQVQEVDCLTAGEDQIPGVITGPTWLGLGTEIREISRRIRP